MKRCLLIAVFTVIATGTFLANGVNESGVPGSNGTNDPGIPLAKEAEGSGLLFAEAANSAGPAFSSSTDGRNLNLLIVIDGLRPDYITAELMPNLYEMGRQGVVGERHSAVYPTYTRVNSSSIVTGNYPVTHGLMHNIMWMPEMGEESFNTNSATILRRVNAVTGGDLLTAPTAGELMENAGRLYFVTGSGSTGSLFLQNQSGSGLGIWNARDYDGVPGFFHPESTREEALRQVGEIPEDHPGRTEWVFDAYMSRLKSNTPPDYTLMWIGETDAAGHTHGVGSPETLESVSHVDQHIGRLLRFLEMEALDHRLNIFVTTDHGFSTTTGGFDIHGILAENGLDKDVRIVSNMIYLKRDDSEYLAKITETLQRHNAIGAIYSRPVRSGSGEGKIPGTISTEVIRWNHDRSADLLVSPAWTSDMNEFGFRGTTTFGGTATHGSDSPFDVQIRLIATGPDIKSGGIRSHIPTGNVDFIPTILHLMGIDPPESMEGRILHELLINGDEPGEIRVHEHTHEAAVSFSDGFRYKTRVETLRVGSTSYLRGAETDRKQE